MRDYKTGKLIYHLTSISNMKSILTYGLLPRNDLWNFVDIADQEIIDCRREYKLDNYVPFHFFPKNPFDERVQKSNRDKVFVIITLSRTFARAEGFKILIQHPLSLFDCEPIDFDQGMELIDWDTMNKRQYYDRYCRQVCMAECLIDHAILPEDFCMIFVKDQESKEKIESINRRNFPLTIKIMENMFC